MYSNSNEEEIIDKYLGDIHQGKYIDIGAGEAQRISNTYSLYLKGWRGILIEPFAVYHADIQKFRPEDILIPEAITNRIGMMDMYDTGCLDSFIGKDYQKNPLRKDNLLHQHYTVKCRTVNNLVAEYPNFLKPDFLSIDVETNEDKVLAGCDFTIFRPQLICIEFTVRRVDYRPKWQHFLLPFYESKEIIGGNIFYLRKDNV